jgi:4-amino-4-deoxy-L-arabinose transferase-like glycosyltransferase
MKKDILTIALIILIASVMSISRYSTGQFWWDDFAAYLLQAGAILNGSMAEFTAENGRAIAQSTYPVGPAAYPWGFPLLIAPLYALAGLSISAYKLVNTLAFAAFLGIFYTYARRRFNLPLSAALVSVLAFNPILLKATDLIQADFVFLLLTTAALLLLDLPKLNVPGKIILGGLIFSAFFVRTNGILLLGPLLLLDLLQWRTLPRPDLRLTSLPYLTFFALFALSLLIFPGGQSSYFNHYELFFSPARFIENFIFYLGLPGWLFNGLPLQQILFALTGFACIWGILRKACAELPALAFSLLTLGIFITWPERQGLRFIYPILPFYLIFAAHGLSDLLRRIRPQKTENRPSTTPPRAGGSAQGLNTENWILTDDPRNHPQNHLRLRHLSPASARDY